MRMTGQILRHLTFPLLILVPLTATQQSPAVTLLPASLPACASSCPILQQAQSACVPPAAPATGPASYQSCFCQSGYLAATRAATRAAGTANPAAIPNVCDPQCAASDFQAIAQWYAGYCQQPLPTTTAQVAAVAPTTAAAAAASSTAATAAGQSDGADATATSSGWYVASPFLALPISATLSANACGRQVQHALALGPHADHPFHWLHHHWRCRRAALPPTPAPPPR